MVFRFTEKIIKIREKIHAFIIQENQLFYYNYTYELESGLFINCVYTKSIGIDPDEYELLVEDTNTRNEKFPFINQELFDRFYVKYRFRAIVFDTIRF